MYLYFASRGKTTSGAIAFRQIRLVEGKIVAAVLLHNEAK